MENLVQFIEYYTVSTNPYSIIRLPEGCMADWEQQFIASIEAQERVSYHISPAQEEDQNSKFKVPLLLNVYNFCIIVKSS